MNIKERSQDSQLMRNLISGCVVLCINLAITFFLSPFIISQIGIEANGFINLANNFVLYASLATIALNSMAGRFVSIEIHRNRFDKANQYYASIITGNLFFAGIIFIAALILLVFLKNIINIPDHLVHDVRILFALIFIQFLLNTIFSCLSLSFFIKNRLDIQSVVNMQANILKVILILILFSLFIPNIFYLGVASLAMAAYSLLLSYRYKKRLLPELKYEKKHFSFQCLKEVILSGIWNTVLKTGEILLSGLDLLITNLLIGPIQMGILALAKTVPSVFSQLSGTITSVFTPSLTIYYAKGQSAEMVAELKKGMKITGILLTIPLSILILFGSEFFHLWIPSQNAHVLHVLSILTCFSLVFTSGTQCLYNVFVIENKLKLYSLIMLLSGVFSTIIVLILISATNLGMYAVAGTSSLIAIMRNLFFIVPFSAKYLNLKWNAFVPEAAYSLLCVSVLFFIGYIIKQIMRADTWLSLILVTLFTSVIGLVINVLIVLSKTEKKSLITGIRKRLRR